MKIIRRMLVFLVIFVLLGAFVLWNNCIIETEVITVGFENLPEAFSGLRIAVLSDLHGREFLEGNRYLLTQVKKSSADLICICGDLIDDDRELSVLPPLLRGLCAIAPTYYVTGNHEWQLTDRKALFQTLEDCGVRRLENDFEIVERSGQRLVLAGVDDPCGPRDQKSPQEVMEGVPEGFVVMLDHRNDRLSMWAELGADLVLSGHCHGGVVRLPLVGGVFGTNRELFPEYDSGLYEKDGTTLFVSRGLGFTNIRLRLFNRPQLAVLQLVNNS